MAVWATGTAEETNSACVQLLPLSRVHLLAVLHIHDVYPTVEKTQGFDLSFSSTLGLYKVETTCSEKVNEVSGRRIAQRSKGCVHLFSCFLSW